MNGDVIAVVKSRKEKQRKDELQTKKKELVKGVGKQKNLRNKFNLDI